MKYRIINSKEEWDAYAKTGKPPYMRYPLVAWRQESVIWDDFNVTMCASIPKKFIDNKEAWAAGFMAGLGRTTLCIHELGR